MPHRLLLLSDDVEIAIDLMVALEEADHQVAHVFHLEDAMVRAKVARFDALIVAAPRSDGALARTWPLRHPAVPLILVAPSDEARRLARASGSACLPAGVHPHVLVRVVDDRIARARTACPAAPASGTRKRALRVIVLVRRSMVAALESDQLRRELEAECLIAPDVRGAAALLDERVDAIVMDSELLMDPAACVVLQQRLRARRLPVVPLHFDSARGVNAVESALRAAGGALRGVVPDDALADSGSARE